MYRRTRLLRRRARAGSLVALGERLERRLALATSTLSIGDAAVTETDVGTTNLVFTVTRGGDTASAINVNFSTSPDTAQSGVDFAHTSGILTMAAGATSGAITVPVLGDTLDEDDEVFAMHLTGVRATSSIAPTFAARSDFATGSNPFELATADFNGDGRLDLATANGLGNSVSVLFNTTAPGAAAPTFAAKVDFSTGLGTKPTFVVTGDFNGDGRPDIAATNFTASKVSVFLNATAPGAAAPSFSAKADFTVGTNPRAIFVADFDLDSRPDLAVANLNSDNVSILRNATALGAATASFAPKVDFAAGALNANTRAIAVGDLNNDGRPDVATGSAFGNRLVTLLNTTVAGGTVSFAPRQEFMTPLKPVSVEIADLNGDGLKDVITANGDSNNASVFLNTTAPGATTVTFATRTEFAAGVDPFDVEVSDLNGDGLLDLTVADRFSTTISVLRSTTQPGAAAASFAPRVTFATGTQPRGVLAADFNGDGKPDVAASNYTGNTVSVLLNTTNYGGGLPDFPNTGIAVLGAPGDIDLGDLTGDGRPDVVVTNAGPSGGFSVLPNATTPGAATPSFGASQDFAIGSFSSAIGDLSGDGRQDLVVADSGTGELHVLFNTTLGGGALTFAAPQSFATGPNPVATLIGDINGDGRADLVSASLTNDQLSVLLNTTLPGGTASFAARQDFATGIGSGSSSTSIALADFNGDGRLDLVASNMVDATVSVLLNTTAPGAAAALFALREDFATDSDPFSVAVADFNGDGRRDIATANLSGTISVLLNTTAPGSAVPSFSGHQEFSSGDALFAIAASDVSGDGRADLVAADNFGAALVLRNTTAPGAALASFAAAQSSTVELGAAAIAAGDLNGDGRADLAVANLVSGSASVLFNTPLVITDSQGTGTILDNDLPPTVQWTTAEQFADEAAGTVTITAQLSQPSGKTVVIPLSINPAGTADDPADYSTSAGEISIPPLSLTGSVSLTIVDDAEVESNETVIVDMGVPTNATAAGITTHTLTIGDNEPATIAARHVYYNKSAWDGNATAANAADDGALATDKSALLPGGTGSLANYASFSKGITGIFIDITNMPGPVAAADFAFKTGNVNNTAAWTPLAAAPVVTLRAGAGAGGSDRISLTWPDDTIKKTWLQVTMLATAGTGLAANDVFYFGNAVGEAGDTTANALVNATDEIQARANPRNIVNPAPITFLYDYNRDKLVNATDQIIARSNTTNVVTALRLIVPTAIPGGVPPAAGALADAALVDPLDEAVDVLAGRRKR